MVQTQDLTLSGTSLAAIVATISLSLQFGHVLSYVTGYKVMPTAEDKTNSGWYLETSGYNFSPISCFCT